METKREGSRVGYTFVFEDEDLQRFKPGTVRYRVDDLTNGSATPLIEWTDVSPDYQVDVILPASAQRILNDRNAYELRLLTVQSDWDTDNQLSEDREYRVLNLAGFQ